MNEDHQMEAPQCEGKLSFLDNVATVELPQTPEGWSVVPSVFRSYQPFQVFFDSVLLVLIRFEMYKNYIISNGIIGSQPSIDFVKYHLYRNSGK